MAISLQMILAYALGLLALYAFGWLLLVPSKFLYRLLLNGLAGGLLLLVLNFFRDSIGFALGMNPITALIAGLLGVPGVALILLFPVLTGG